MPSRPNVRMLSPDDVRLVHEASLEILEKTGVLYENKTALDILEANGQKVDRDRGVAWIKPDLVERCIASAPRQFVLASRDGKNDAVIDGERMHHMTDGQASFTLDEVTGERRPSTLHDLCLSTLLADALDPVKVMWSTVFPTDASTDRRALFEAAASFMWSPKHFQMVGGVQDPEDVAFLLEMIDIVDKQPPGRKQVGPGAESHWWNLLTYVYGKRPALLQMGGGGLQASPNYDFVYSVREFPKLAWVYDTPLFVYAKKNGNAPPGEVIGSTANYELLRLPAPGIVSPIQITGVLPEGESRAGSPVRKAAIDWLKSDAPLSDHHLAYAGYGGPGPAPDAKVLRALSVDPSPGDMADIYAEVEVHQPTTFVARESWHPRWHAYVDGTEVPIRRVTPDFPAIDVAAGNHVLAFRFERPWWATASWLAWPAITLGAWWIGRRRRRQLPTARVVET